MFERIWMKPEDETKKPPTFANEGEVQIKEDGPRQGSKVVEAEEIVQAETIEEQTDAGFKQMIWLSKFEIPLLEAQKRGATERDWQKIERELIDARQKLKNLQDQYHVRDIVEE